MDFATGIINGWKIKHTRRRYMEFTDISNIWKPIPGYDGRYEACLDGRIRRIYKKSGKSRLMTAYEKKSTHGSPKLFVKLVKDGDGSKGKEKQVSQCVYTAFRGSIPHGYVIVHLNGLYKDNHLGNLDALTRKEVGVKYGPRSRSRAVAKIAVDGTVIDVYPSARQAAKHNNMSYQTVLDRCNAAVKRIAPDGYDYAWDSDAVSMRYAMQRIARENGQ